jgi:hypothetical protein
MEYYTTIEINNQINHIAFKPVLYMDLPLWEITLNDKNYLIRKNDEGQYVCTDSDLNSELLHVIGHAIDYSAMKDAS